MIVTVPNIIIIIIITYHCYAQLPKYLHDILRELGVILPTQYLYEISIEALKDISTQTHLLNNLLMDDKWVIY